MIIVIHEVGDCRSSLQMRLFLYRVTCDKRENKDGARGWAQVSAEAFSLP